MSPLKILGFLISVFAALFTIAALFPSNGIRVSEKITLSFPTVRDVLFPKEKQHNLAAEQIIKVVNADTADSSPILSTSAESEKIEFLIDTTDVTRLHYPDNNKAILYPLFAMLDSLKRFGGSARILHYGDSQIEEDRMTSVIRAQLQKQFGGSGVGLACPVPVSVPMSINHSWSDNLERYVVFGNYWDRAEHNRYGVMCAFAKYSGSSASVSFKESRLSLEINRRIERCKLLYGYGENDSRVELIADGVSTGTKMLRAGKDFKVVEWTLDSLAKEVKFEFSGESPDLYAIALDGKNGISVDNIPIRGSSGIDFTKLDSALFSEIIKQLNVRAVILQFGGNVVPSIKGQKDIEWYRRVFAQQLNLFKKLGVQILMIGLADMSTSKRGEMITYPYLPAIRDVTKEEVFKVGGVFWDMFEAMGGENSMPEYVKATPALAIDDYVHFNRDGAAKMAKLFTKSLMKDYNEYKMRMELKSLTEKNSTN